MNEIHDDDQIELPLTGNLMERIDLGTNGVDECNPAFLSFWIPLLRFIEHGRNHCFGRVVGLAQTRLCSGCGRVGFTRRSLGSGRISTGVRTKRSTT
jgi:hypothetical protein